MLCESSSIFWQAPSGWVRDPAHRHLLLPCTVLLLPQRRMMCLVTPRRGLCMIAMEKVRVARAFGRGRSIPGVCQQQQEQQHSSRWSSRHGQQHA